MTERAEFEFGEGRELAAAQEATERNLRLRAEREGREYVPPADAKPIVVPEILPENEPVWELLSACSSQLILGGLGGVAGISHATLAWRMDLLEIPIEERYETDVKFRVLEALFLRSINSKLETSTKNE